MLLRKMNTVRVCVLVRQQQSFHISHEDKDAELQTVTLCNTLCSTTGPTILHYTAGSDGQYYIPGLYRSGVVTIRYEMLFYRALESRHESA